MNLQLIKKLLLFLVLLVGCKNSEPAFIVRGDKSVTKDVKVNIRLLKQDRSTMATVYFNGESYEVNNQGTLRYIIYVSYKDSLFHKFEMDNLHSQVMGEPVNEIVIQRTEHSGILASYRALKENDDSAGTVLKPWKKFVSQNDPPVVLGKEKFTRFYMAE